MQESRDPGLFVPIKARALLVPFPVSGEQGKNLPTSDCEQGEVLKLIPTVPCKHKVRRKTAVVLFVSWNHS